MPAGPPLNGPYNAAVDLLGRNLTERPEKIAFIDPEGAHTYSAVAVRAARAGAGLLSLGLGPGDRVVLVLLDGIDFVCCFLGAIRVGLIPIPLNTLLATEDYGYILTDCGARAAVFSEAFQSVLTEAVTASGWEGQLVVCGGKEGDLDALQAAAPEPGLPLASRAEDVAFWLYSSGSTGRPKGTPHRHRSLALTADLFARQVFGLQTSDVVFSAAKLFFAYGLGNALTFPMYVGATAVLWPGRVTPEVVADLVQRHGVTIFCGVPTLYATLLAARQAPAKGGSNLRLCLSAGEALPAELGRTWSRTTGVEIVDGIGSTEMLHIYVSNRPGQVRYGVTGRATPGYEVRLVGEDGADIVGPGEIGELYVRGPTMAVGYWNLPDKTQDAFRDGWMRSGDKFELDAAGSLIHRGRADDMLKVSGVWVSPIEVEATLLRHPAVLEVAVIGAPDASGLVKTKAFVVPKPGIAVSETLSDELRQFVKRRLAPYKYPRMIEFIDALPKTATGKIRRHVLREREAQLARPPPGEPA
jgi:benzoate-CoA ligase